MRALWRRSKAILVRMESSCVNKYTSITIIGEQDERAVEVSFSC